MKKDRKNYEKKKTNIYNNTLGAIAGLILVWCIFLFIPMNDLEQSISNLLKNVPMNIANSVFYLLVAAMGALAFSVGFFGIKRLLYTTDDFIHDEIKDDTKKEAEEKV